MSDPNRGTGRTTRQILAAPQRAYFVAPTRAAAGYTRHLAAFLRRPDIHIETPDFVTDERYRGLTRGSVILDHAIFDLRLLRSEVVDEFRRNMDPIPPSPAAGVQS